MTSGVQPVLETTADSFLRILCSLGKYKWQVRQAGFPPVLRGRRAILLDLLRFLNDRVRSVAGHHPACRPGHHGFILKPEESEVVDALRKIRLDDDVSRNHGAWNVSVVSAVVAV